VNFGEPGRNINEHFGETPHFDHYNEESGHYERITDSLEVAEFFRNESPVTHVSAEAPPILIRHGTADGVIPFQQAELLAERLESEGVPHRLVPIEGHGHDILFWDTLPEEGEFEVFPGEKDSFVGWFVEHLPE